MSCDHMDFAARISTVRLSTVEGGPITAYTAEIHIECAQCHEPFEFIGLPAGSLPSEPTSSVDGTEARMPIRPVSAPEGFGLNVPGFSIRVSEG